MAEIIKELTLDVARKNSIQAIIGKQYDYNSRFLKVHLTNEGVPLIVPTGTVVTINAARADEKKNSFLGEVNEDGSVTVPITQWMLALDDIVTCDISIVDNAGRKLSTTNFVIEVEPSNYSEGDLADVTASIGESTGITGASVDAVTFLLKIDTLKEMSYLFFYNGSGWYFDSVEVTLSDYGITVEGTPLDGDSVLITVAEKSEGILLQLVNKAVSELDDKKLDKVTDVSTYGRVYGISTMGEQITFGCQDAAVNASLPIRDNAGTFQVGTPTKDKHPATKSYVDAREVIEYMLYTSGYSENPVTDGSDNQLYQLNDPTGQYVISGTDGTAYYYNAGQLECIHDPTNEDHDKAWRVWQGSTGILDFSLGSSWGNKDAVIFVAHADKCGYCVRNSYSCFIEGTKVLLRDPKTQELTEKNIENVVAGDHMAFWTPKLNRLTQTRTVVPPLVGECDRYHRLSFSDGRTVDVFGNQFFWDVDLDKLVNWLDMVAGETRVCTAEGDIITYTGAEEIVPPAPVKHYTLMTYRSRYLANGIQVGDKVELFYPRLANMEELMEYWNALPEKDQEYFKRKWREGMRRRNWKFSPEYHEAMKPITAERRTLKRTINENQTYLDSTDYLVAKLSEGLITEAEFAEPREKRQEARDAINAAREALTALETRIPEIEKSVHETVCPPGRYRGVFAGKTRAETEPVGGEA